MPRVVFDPPGKMNLLGYFLRSVMERNLVKERGRRAFKALKGTILVGASDMRVTIHFDGDDLVISAGERGNADARVSGSLDTLLKVALGAGLVGPFLSGRLKVGGKPWRLLPLLALLRTESSA